MRRRIETGGSVVARIVLVAIFSCLAGMLGSRDSVQSMQESADAASGIRVIHGVADAGPLDVYLDGGIALIGVAFGESSGNLVLGGGEHTFAVVPTGADPEAAIAAGPVSLDEGRRYFAALLGTSDSASVGLYVIDDRPLDAGQARFRIISGAPDVGEIVPAFSGGDPLSEPLGFGDASQYATIEAGNFNLDMLDGTSGELILAVPETAFAEGTATDVILMGQLALGTLEALILPTSVDLAPVVGRAARIVVGTCTDPGAVAAELGVVQEGVGAFVGVPNTQSVAQGYGLAPISFAALTETPHAIVVADTTASSGSYLACGDIGGQLTETGSLVIAVAATERRNEAGVAVLAPALENPEATGVSVFLAMARAAEAPSATPEATTP